MPRSRRRKKQSTTSIIFLILILTVIYLYEQGYLDRLIPRLELPSQEAQPQQPGAAPALEAAYSASGSWYQVYFTRPFYPERPANRRGGLDSAIVADIDTAKRSVDVAAFDIDLQSIGEALIRARQRGLTVRVVTDDENLAAPEVSELMGRLQQAGIPVTFDRREPFMHNKVIIVDGTLLWTGSMNLTINDVYRNNNNMLRFAVPELVANYQTRFEWLFAGRPAGQPAPETPHRSVRLPGDVRVQNFFSPRGGADEAIAEQLRNARSSIRVLAFSYTSDPQTALLIERQRTGILVQGVFEARNASGTGADFGALQAAGLQVLEDGNCYIMHHKVYIIDERTVITGSYNFSTSAERSNDENLLIIDDSALASAYLQEFQRVYQQAERPTRCGS